MTSARLSLIMKAVLAFASVLAWTPGFGQRPPVELTSLGSIEVMVKATNGTPLDEVDVRLSGAQDALVTTGRNGRAVFRDLAPGSYEISAARYGFLLVDPDGSGSAQAHASVEIGLPKSSSGDQSTAVPIARQLKFTLTPGAILAGRVQDPKGCLIEGVRTTIGRVMIRNGKRVLADVRPTAEHSYNPCCVTNDFGEFRFFWLPPGEYLVRAEGLLTGGKKADYDPIFYYPGTADFTMAGKVVIHEGEEIRADFTVPEDKGVSISGTIVGPGSKEFTELSLSLSPAAPGLMLPKTQGFSVSDDHKFEIGRVPPGSYHLRAEAKREDSGSFMGERTIEVGQSNVFGIVIALEAQDDDSEIRGRFSLSPDVQTQLQSLPLTQRAGRIVLRAGFADVDARSNLSVSVRTDGEEQKELEFSSGARHGQYRLISLQGLPPDGYLADLRQNSRSIYDDGIVEVGKDPVDLEFVVEDNGGAIEGTILVQSEAENTPSFAVVLVPDKPRRGNPFFYKRLNVSLNTEEPAAFAFKGVAPGSYRVFAFDVLPRGEEFNPDLIARHEQRSVSVTIASGVRLNGIQPPLIRTGKP